MPCTGFKIVGTWKSMLSSYSLTVGDDCSYRSTSGDVGRVLGRVDRNDVDLKIEVTSSSSTGELGVGLHSCHYSFSPPEATEFQWYLDCEESPLRIYLENK